MKKFLLLILILWSFSIFGSGSGPFRNYIHRGWSSDEGLPQNSVYSIAQDKQGFLWMGTAEGLVKFDGTEFELFDKYTTSTIESNVILAILVDENCLWIGVKSGGIVRKCGDEFEHFSEKDGLTSNTVTSIVKSKNKILIGTFGGRVTVFENGKFKPYSKNTFLPDSFIYDMVTDKDDLYVATDDGLYAIKGDKVLKYSENEGLPEMNIRGLFLDSKGDLWVGTSDSGVARLKKDTNKFDVFQKKDGLSSGRIFAIEEDNQGKIWIGTIGGGLNIFDGKEFKNYTKKDGLSSDVVRTLFKDRAGNMWAGTFGGGIDQFRKGLFSSITMRDGLSDNVIFALLEAKNGDIYAGTYGKGLNVIKKDGTVKVLNASNGLSGDIPAAIFQDSKERVWVGTYGTYLNILEKNGTITHIGPDEGLEMATVTSFLELDDGTIYIGGFNHALAVYKDGKFKTLKKEGILKNRTVWGITLDKDGAILLATDGTGIIRIKDNVFEIIDTKKGLNDNKITHIYRDDKNILWASSYDNGMNIIRPDGKITHIKKSDGLFDDTIYTSIEDDEGNLWMSSNRGLFSAKKTDLLNFKEGSGEKIKVKSYSWKDGMPSNECNGGFQKAALKTSDGRLMFPTIKGIAVMDAGNVQEEPYMPTPVITAIYIDGERQELKESYELPPKTTKVKIEYTAPTFSVPEKVNFRYKLEGFDSDWVPAGKQKSTSIMNLNPGTYHFRVGVSDINGNWNTETASIKLIQVPAFHQTIWFRVLLFLIIAIVIFIPINIKLKRMRETNEELTDSLEETQEELKQISEELDSKYASSSLDDADLESYSRQIKEVMESEKPYLDNELSIRKLASMLDMQPHHLSQVINSSFDMNFYTFINNYRIEEVIKLMKDPDRQHHTILAIAYDSGFKSKSSFNTIFKKMTGKTPSEYRDQLEI